MAFHEDLLEQAQHLARRERGRPRQASLRRAISTAYYALFHLLISETIKNWKRQAERNTLARMFEHAFMAKACSTKRDELNTFFKARPSPGSELEVSRHLHFVVLTFLRMLQHRQTADYDNSIRWTRTDALETIQSVATAFESWKLIRKEPAAQNFLVTLLIKERKP
jgi:uncharacterized protein (UPF0332 family)